MSHDDLDFLLDDVNAALEAKFRELESSAAVESLRSRAEATSASNDPLEALKDQLDGETSTKTERVVLLTCPACKAKNRTSLAKLRALMEAKCGGCGAALAFEHRRR